MTASGQSFFFFGNLLLQRFPVTLKRMTLKPLGLVDLPQ
jgi:hypothetical protein